MLRIFCMPDLRRQKLSAAGMFLLGVFMFGLCGSALAQDDNLDELLQQVGEDYAIGYSSPFLYAFGPDMNSAMYQTAAISWSGLTWGIGIKGMTAHLNEEDQTFRKVLKDQHLGDYFDDPAAQGQYGDIVMGGPTIFGDTNTTGSVIAYQNGIPVFQQDTIAGFVDTRYVPLATPEGYIGGYVGLKLTVRYFPDMDLGDYGKTKYFGWGLQWNVNGVLENLPVDLMIGFFDQQLKVGTLFDTNASTYFAGLSKDFGILTPYGGFALEDSDMTVTYVQDTGTDINFKVDGIQKNRITLGLTLNIGVKLNVEMGLGSEITTYAAGLMFGM